MWAAMHELCCAVQAPAMKRTRETTLKFTSLSIHKITSTHLQEKNHTVTHSHAWKISELPTHKDHYASPNIHSAKETIDENEIDQQMQPNPFIRYDFNSKSYKRTRETTFKFPLLSIRKNHFNRLERNKFTYSYAFNSLRSPPTGIITHRQNWLCQRDHHRIKTDQQCSPNPL